MQVFSIPERIAKPRIYIATTPKYMQESLKLHFYIYDLLKCDSAFHIICSISTVQGATNDAIANIYFHKAISVSQQITFSCEERNQEKYVIIFN